VPNIKNIALKKRNMIEMAMEDKKDGGVILSPRSKGPQKDVFKRGWCFTINNWSQDEKTILTAHFEKLKCRWIMGEEVGKEGTPHLQGSVYFESAKSFSAMKKLMPTAHLEIMRGTWDQNTKYCSKEGKATGKLVDDYEQSLIDRRQAKLNKFLNHPWKEWQREIIEMVSKPAEKRKIYWIVGTVGGEGKSELVEYLALLYDVILAEGKKSDVFNQCISRVEKFKKEKKALTDPKCILCDVPRSIDSEYVSYTALEKLKDGLCYSGKYEGGRIEFVDQVHVLVFSNNHPILSKLSKDRWVIIDLDKVARETREAPSSLLARSPTGSPLTRLVRRISPAACLEGVKQNQGVTTDEIPELCCGVSDYCSRPNVDDVGGHSESTGQSISDAVVSGGVGHPSVLVGLPIDHVKCTCSRGNLCLRCDIIHGLAVEYYHNVTADSLEAICRMRYGFEIDDALRMEVYTVAVGLALTEDPMGHLENLKKLGEEIRTEGSSSNQ
jgi:hypothetical protein